MTQMSYGEALQALNTAATAGGEKPLPKPWPRTPRGLAGDLRRLAPALRTQGWTVTFHPHGREGSGVTIHPPGSPPQPPCDDSRDNCDGAQNQPSQDNTNKINMCDDGDDCDDYLRAGYFHGRTDSAIAEWENEEEINKDVKRPSQPSPSSRSIQNNGLYRDDAKKRPSRDCHVTVTEVDPVPAMKGPPQPCPGCKHKTTWLIRATGWTCSHETLLVKSPKPA